MVLTTIREFPSLKPKRFQPVPTSLLGEELRTDILWSAVVHDQDRIRVGSLNQFSRADGVFSGRKLFPQKGSGRARTGDANSPIKKNKIRALAVKAPTFHATALPKRTYFKALRIALSQKYKEGRLFITDSHLNFPSNDPKCAEHFLQATRTHEKHILFITSKLRRNLLESTEKYGSIIDVGQKEAIKVKDILKSDRIYIELPALEYFMVNWFKK